MTKLSDYPAIVRLVKALRSVQEAIEIGSDYYLTVKGNTVIPVPTAQAITFLNNRLVAIKNELNTYGVDADA